MGFEQPRICSIGLSMQFSPLNLSSDRIVNITRERRLVCGLETISHYRKTNGETYLANPDYSKGKIIMQLKRTTILIS